jgi:hypothetical protein
MSRPCVLMPRFLVLVLSILAAAPAFAWDEPSGFRGVPWGASVETVKEKIPEVSCYESVACSGDLWVGTVKTYTRLLLREGGLDAVIVAFPADDFNIIKPIFIERYGQPTSRSTPEVQNKAGARFENEVLLWAGKKVQVTLRRYGDSLTYGLGTIRTQTGLEEEAKKGRDRAKKGKKDL